MPAMLTGMDTHLDTLTPSGRNRSETPAPAVHVREKYEALFYPAMPERQKHDVSPDAAVPALPLRRRLALTICLGALLLGAATIAYLPDVAGRLAALPGAVARPEPATTAIATTAVGGQSAGDPQPAAVSPPTGREITGSGFVVAPRMTAVFSQYEGTVTRVAVVLGDAVEAGQALVALEDKSARFTLEQARAARAQADLVLAARAIDLTQARNLLERSEILAASNTLSRQALEDARTAVQRAANALAQGRQSVESADLAVRRAEERLAELTVRAPFSGIVTRLNATVGDTVLSRADSVREGQSLLTITDTRDLAIDADVAESAIAALKPGLSGEAQLDGFPDRPFTVAIKRLAPTISAEKGTVTIRLSLTDPPAGIRPNMAARIRIDLEKTGEPKQ